MKVKRIQALDYADQTNVFSIELKDKKGINILAKAIAELNCDIQYNKRYYFEVIKPYEGMYDSHVKREEERSIGQSDKPRIILVICGEERANLIISANNQQMEYKNLLKIYEDLKLNGTITEKEKNSLKIESLGINWGIPEWNSNDKIYEGYSVNINDFIEDLTPYNIQQIMKAALNAFKVYSDENYKLLLEANTSYERVFRQAMIKQDEGTLLEVNDRRILEENYAIKCVSTFLEYEESSYCPALVSKYPFTIVTSFVREKLKTIEVMSNQKQMNLMVFKQLVKVFITELEQLKNNANHNNIEKKDIKILNDEKAIRRTSQMEYEQISIAKYVEKMRQKFSDNVAISDEKMKVSYRELDENSNWIASNLKSLGLKAGDRIIVSMNQNAELIEIILGIVKAGGIYIPVDPKYPMERINFIIKDSLSKYIVLDSNIKIENDEILVLKSSQLLKEPDNNIEFTDVSDKSGYIIYTSGTTGVPKGVSVSINNVIALVNATKYLFDLNEKDVWTMFHSASFDFSVWEMWGCLLTGGHLIVVNRDTAKSPYDFYDLLCKEKVTVLNQTPSAFYAINKIDAESRKLKLSSLRLLIFGGEALDRRKLSSWLGRYPITQCRVVNMYGITETTVHVTYREIHSKEPEWLSNSIGQPLDGWNISIRNEKGELCLIGMPGEIWVSGVGVADGYVNRDKLNKEKFQVINEERWYKSGDLGRMRPDGSVDYLGRIDNQVKIRGFRIELDEIKNVLCKYMGIEDAVVTVKDYQTTNQKELVAFIKTNINISKAGVREFLKSHLPEYMIPSRMIIINEIPLTTNGKIDYKKLLELLDKQNVPDLEERQQNKNIYLDIWCKVLGHEIDVDDNFFEYGGNSLLAVELLAELKKDVAPFLKLKDIYIYASPRAMEKYCNNVNLK